MIYTPLDVIVGVVGFTIAGVVMGVSLLCWVRLYREERDSL